VADWSGLPPAAGSNRVEARLGARLALAPPTPPGVRVRTTQRLLAEDHGPERIHRTLPTAVSGNAERTVRAG
jgi:hypothetical protein